MDLHYLKVFNILASELSFSKAANLLYISQPAVSIQIKKLEEELGFKLFHRSGRNLYLTDNGKLLYGYTKKIFALLAEVESIFSTQAGNMRGLLEIGASNTPGTYILPAILGEFKELYPDVVTSLHIGNTYEIERMAIENRIDFAVNGGDISYSGEVQVEKLSEDEVILIASPSNSLAKLQYVERADLANAKCIAHEKNSQLYKLFESIWDELDLPINIVMAMGHIDAIKQAVAANLGISAVPASAAKTELKLGLLKQLKIKGKRWFYPYNIIYNKKRRISPACKKLMELVRKKMKVL